MTKVSKEDIVLDRILCIHYLECFWKDQDEMLILIDSRREVNVMTPTYVSKLGLKVRPTNVKVQKFDGSTLKIFGMVLVSFQVENKLKKTRFFQETFLVANTSVEVILRMLFLAFSNSNVSFALKKLTWRSYATLKALSITRRIKVINQKEFAIATLDPNKEVFVVHVVSLSLRFKVLIHRTWEAQIVALDTEKVIVQLKYSDYANVILEASAIELPEHTNINDHPIDLVDDKQSSYDPIYSLGLMELKILKTYIEINLVNSFIQPSQSPACTPILLIKKKNSSFWLCINYWGLNNLIIKN